MSGSNFDVIVIGAGPAGISAAIGLARSDFSVLVIEGGVFPGAENWSGAIYFTENLAHPELLGKKGVQNLPYERYLTRRGMLMTNGHTSVGISYRNLDTFSDCYSVLRPTYDHYLAEVAKGFGVTVLSETTVTSLVRHRGRVVGVNTDRGPFYSDLVFLAEGDASHLVTQEGYDRISDTASSQRPPSFLQGIREVIPMPADEIEQIFGVGLEEGAAFEILLRNGTIRNRTVPLNLGGFIYTNADSLSVGLVLSLENLTRHFGGDHNRLMEWFKSLPEIQQYTGGEPATGYGAKIIRGGGHKELSRWVDDGLAIGGAASGMGTDFPYPNYTGPATMMGLQISRAAREIRAAGLGFTREALETHYVTPVQATHYYKNVEYLEHWPEYVEKTSYFFGRNIDLVLGGAYALTRSKFSTTKKIWRCSEMLRKTLPPSRWREMWVDGLHLNRALRLTTVLGKALQKYGASTFHANRPAAGSFTFLYSRRGRSLSLGLFPMYWRRFLVTPRYRQAFAQAAHVLYANDCVPLETKLSTALSLFFRRLISPLIFLDLLILLDIVVTFGAMAVLQWITETVGYVLKRPTVEEYLNTFYQRYLTRTRLLANLTEGEVLVRQTYDQKLAMSTYFSEKHTHIHVLRPDHLEDHALLVHSPLWHICPAKVYEVQVDDVGQSHITVNFENCVKCESCWRGSTDVDWSRARQQRLLYRVHSPASIKLFQRICNPPPGSGTFLLATKGNEIGQKKTPEKIAGWLPGTLGASEPLLSPLLPDGAPALHVALQKLRWHLDAFSSGLAQAPRTLGNDDRAWLERLAFYAASIGRDADLLLRASLPMDHPAAGAMSELWSELRQKLAQMQVHVYQKKFFWADAAADQIRQHHLPAVLRLVPAPPAELPFPPLCHQLWEMEEATTFCSSLNPFRRTIRAQIEAAFDKQAVKDLEKGEPLTETQTACLRACCQAMENPAAESPPNHLLLEEDRRRIILEELGRKDPSVAFLVSHHWLASDLLEKPRGSEKWRSLAFQPLDVESWGSLGNRENADGSGAQYLFVLTALAEEFAVIQGNKVYGVNRSRARLEPQATLGFAAAKVAQVTFPKLSEGDAHPLLEHWRCQLVADLTSIALGAGRLLLERARVHASTRVQFPGTFRDEEGRDPIAKFGAVKQFLSEMETSVYLLETMSHFAPEEDWRVIAYLTGELIGTQPGSLAYNCGQIFGGTAYSEDDVISKFYRDSALFAFWLERDVEAREALAVEGAASGPTDEDLELLEIAARRGALRDACETLMERSQESPSSPKLWALKLLLLRTTASLERGEGTEKRVQCCLLYSSRIASNPSIPVSVELGKEILRAGYFDQPLHKGGEFSYDQLIKIQHSYELGDYLRKPLGSLAVRYLPEHLHLDVNLRAYHERLQKIFAEGLSPGKTDGLSYSRYVEKIHHVPDADLQMLIQNGFMRMFIPKDLGGEGRPKAEYYILVGHSMRYGEPGLALTIQAHSSIGTTPILLGLKQDLPRAQKELDSFLADQDWVASLNRKISRILEDLNTPKVVTVKDRFTKLGEFVKEAIGKRASLRSLAADFLGEFIAAGRAGQKLDLKGFERHLFAAQAILPQLKGRAELDRVELDRRKTAHQQFLRYIASGTTSCFALTEPSAGSDTASIGTRAVLRRVEVLTDETGGKYFFLDAAQKHKRRLLDADQWDLKPPPPDVDVAQIRSDGDKEFYEFYELNGAKMWITNAHIAGALVMYARTDSGPTGFMLRAPVEGLTVGIDELKMGQRGSPTNELGLSNVRVPRENIIGIEGRGQVNALETLNVGRMGLAVSSMAMMQKIIEQTRAFVAEQQMQELGWVQQLCGEMAEELFAVESLAFELTGLFDHPGTKSARVESAIGKYYGSEALHRVIRMGLSIHGLRGQTAAYEMEKHLRDARILNIYEGTNEVQRFLILRDLVEQVLPNWEELSGMAGLEANEMYLDEVATVDEAKNLLRAAVRNATQTFGQQVWQNPNFQPTFFPLAEVAGLIKVCDSVLSRVLWLEKKLADSPDDQRHRELSQIAARNYLERAFVQMDAAFEQVEHQMERLKKGHYPPEIRIATLSLSEEGGGDLCRESIVASGIRERLDPKISTLVVLQPVPIVSPCPALNDGQLIEPYWTLSPADRQALALALQWGAPVTVVGCGPRFVCETLRLALAAGATDALWVNDETVYRSANALAAQITEALKAKVRRLDIVVTGDEILAAALAARLEMPFVKSVATGEVRGKELQLSWVGGPQNRQAQSFPVVIAVAAAADGSEKKFTTQGYMESFDKPLSEYTPAAASPPMLFKFLESVEPEKKSAILATPEAAAKAFGTEAHLHKGAETASHSPYCGILGTIPPRQVIQTDTAYLLLDRCVNTAELEMACALANGFGLSLEVLIFCSDEENKQREFVGQILGFGVEKIFLIPSPDSQGARRHALDQLLTKEKNVLLLGNLQWNETFAALEGGMHRKTPASDTEASLILNSKGVVDEENSLVFEAPVFGGKLSALYRVSLPMRGTHFLTLHPEAIAPPIALSVSENQQNVFRIPLKYGKESAPSPLERFLNEAKKDLHLDSLKEAEFIIDIGYAIRTREQLEMVVSPLKKTLAELGVQGVSVGGTRKVVEELKLLPHDQQIGQTGVTVNPRILIALGVSGAPQHVNYLGDRAVIFAFNKDPEAPLLTLNQRAASPKVYPIVGDLYENLPLFLAALRREFELDISR